MPIFWVAPFRLDHVVVVHKGDHFELKGYSSASEDVVRDVRGVWGVTIHVEAGEIVFDQELFFSWHPERDQPLLVAKDPR